MRREEALPLLPPRLFINCRYATIAHAYADYAAGAIRPPPSRLITTLPLLLYAITITLLH